MKKSILVITLLLILLVMGSSVFGEENTSAESEIIKLVQADVDATNALIDSKINDAVASSIVIVMLYNQNVALAESELKGNKLENRLESLLDNKDTEINNLINNLINETNAIALDMFNRAAELGVIVICELVPVEIDGQIIMIDPIKVVGT